MKFGFKPPSDEFFVEEIWKDNEAAIQRFHEYCRDYHSRSFKKLFTDKSMEKDFFQDSFVKLWKEIKHGSIFVSGHCVYKKDRLGNIRPLTCSLRTYLMSITRKDYLQLKNKEMNREGIHLEPEYESLVDVDDKDDAELKKEQIISTCVRRLPPSCYKIIHSFYYENYTLDEIMQCTDYTSKDALKTRKYKCMEKLRRHILSTFEKSKIKP